MQSVKLFSYTKNIDLHAVSATEAISSFMGYDRLVKLRRFLLTTFRLDGDSLKEAERSVEAVLSCTLDILNPNKEAYRFHGLPAIKPAPNTEIFYVYVRPLLATGEARQIQRISQKSGVVLYGLEKGVLWELQVQNEGKTRDELQQEVRSHLVSTTCRQQGLLCNPLFETFAFLEPQQIALAAH